MAALWLVHRAVVVGLVIVGLDTLADRHATLTVVLVLFLIFATYPAAVSTPRWARGRD